MVRRDAGRRGVVVTGMGCVSPLGADAPATWAAAAAGRSGAAPIQSFEANSCPVRIAAECVAVPPLDGVPPRDARHLDRVVILALAAAQEAARDAGLGLGSTAGDRRWGSPRHLPGDGHRRRRNALRKPPGDARAGPQEGVSLRDPHVARQHAERLPGDSLWGAGPQYDARGGLRVGGAGDRRGEAGDRARRCRRDPRRWRRGGDQSPRGERFRRHARAIDPQRRPHRGQSPLRPRPRWLPDRRRRRHLGPRGRRHRGAARRAGSRRGAGLRRLRRRHPHRVAR